ncbi:type III secretion system (T3SS) SseB-like protein [Curtobacterium sp. AG1037]|uniref:SseB family protein n=1 Tax=Curtobacterium sp. AG1037 TaxID=2183990 RepID=UPI000E0C5CF5|nr:SseB family protein [Curtobacterium sp. AG1037]RDH96883.1 type III secretion system (T3SS) SseB-like protein [Curtobacterium sp. AG1037]
MSTNETDGSAFGRGVDKTPPTAAAELRRRMATSPAGFLRSAAWVPWKPEGAPEGGSIAHVIIRDLPFVPVFTDPEELAAGLPGTEGRPVPMSELVTALPEEFGIVVDPTSAEAANFLHADVLANMREQMRGEIPDDGAEGREATQA